MTLVFDQIHPYEKKGGGKNGWKLKILFSTILGSIPNKNNMRIRNMTLVFDQIHPYEKKGGGKNEWKLKLVFSTILMSIPTKINTKMTNMKFIIHFSPNTSVEAV